MYELKMLPTTEELVSIPSNYSRYRHIEATVNTKLYSGKYWNTRSIFFLALMSFNTLPVQLQPYLEYMPGGKEYNKTRYDRDDPFPGVQGSGLGSYSYPPSDSDNGDVGSDGSGDGGSEYDASYEDASGKKSGGSKLPWMIILLICIIFMGYCLYVRYYVRRQNDTQFSQFSQQNTPHVQHIKSLHQEPVTRQKVPVNSDDSRDSEI